MAITDPGAAFVAESLRLFSGGLVQSYYAAKQLIDWWAFHAIDDVVSQKPSEVVADGSTVPVTGAQMLEAYKRALELVQDFDANSQQKLRSVLTCLDKVK